MGKTRYGLVGGGVLLAWEGQTLKFQSTLAFFFLIPWFFFFVVLFFPKLYILYFLMPIAVFFIVDLNKNDY